MATLARSGPIFRRRRRAVRTPPRCDGGITIYNTGSGGAALTLMMMVVLFLPGWT